MRKYTYLYIFAVFAFFVESCNRDKGMLARLDSIDSLMDTNPQEAYDSLTSMKNEYYNYSDKKDFMKYRMLEAKALNKLYRQMPTDSSFLDVVDYFDKHGTDKDKIQCHYLLECIYRDLHDAPKAIEWYNYAIEMLESQENSDDKTNMQLLALSYGEVADLQHSQLLYAEAIKKLQASHCICRTMWRLCNHGKQLWIHVGILHNAEHVGLCHCRQRACCRPILENRKR